MKRRIRALILAGGFGVIVLLVVRTGPLLIAEMFRRVGWNVAVVVALYTVHVVLRALALWRVLENASVRFADVLRVRLSGESIEVLTGTGPFLAEPGKGWLLTRCGLSPVEAFAGVATEYLLYTVVSAALALTAFTLMARHQLIPAALQFAAVGLAGGMAAFLVATGVAAVSGRGLIVPLVRVSATMLGHSRTARAIELIEPVEHRLVAFLHQRPARTAEALAIEALGHALLIAEIWVVLTALGAPFLARDPVVIEGGAKLIAAIFFFVPGQVGAAEAVYAALLPVVGLTATIGLTLAFLRRIRSLCVATAGVLVLAWFDSDSR